MSTKLVYHDFNGSVRNDRKQFASGVLSSVVVSGISTVDQINSQKSHSESMSIPAGSGSAATLTVVEDLNVTDNFVVSGTVNDLSYSSYLRRVTDSGSSPFNISNYTDGAYIGPTGIVAGVNSGSNYASYNFVVPNNTVQGIYVNLSAANVSGTIGEVTVTVMQADESAAYPGTAATQIITADVNGAVLKYTLTDALPAGTPFKIRISQPDGNNGTFDLIANIYALLNY